MDTNPREGTDIGERVLALTGSNEVLAVTLGKVILVNGVETTSLILVPLDTVGDLLGCVTD